MKRSALESSQPVSGVKRERAGPTEDEIGAYLVAQEKCPRVAPHTSLSFERLFAIPRVAFRDITPFFAVCGAVEQSVENPKNSLIRPRRWGKSVLGTAWIEFLRGRRDLFMGTWAESRFRQKPLIGIHLDLTEGGDTVGGCLRAIARALNVALMKAEQVEGYGEAARGKRVSIPPEFPVDDEKWTLSSAKGVLRDLLVAMDDIATLAEREIAMFVDEYDRPSISSLGRRQFDDVNEFFREFYARIKARTSIPFLLLVGSSHLSLAQFFSGANDIVDLSHEPRATAALGYQWADIEQLYGEQLVLLEKLYGFTRAELQDEMGRWYNGYRWSPVSTCCTYNPFSINMFIKTGEFRAHWTETGVPSLLFNKSLFSADVIRLFLSPNASLVVSNDVLRWKKGQLQSPMATSGQKSVLIASGVLSLTSKATPQVYPVGIPNLEARHAAEEILSSCFEAFVTEDMRAVVKAYSDPHGEAYGDAVTLIVVLGKMGSVGMLARSLAGQADVIEIHIHQALVSLILAARDDPNVFTLCSELAVEATREGEKRKWLDLAFRVSGQNTGYAIELECVERPKKALRKSVEVRKKLIHGLKQLVEDYERFLATHGDDLTRYYSCLLFDTTGRLMAYTCAALFVDAKAVVTKLEKGSEASHEVVWVN